MAPAASIRNTSLLVGLIAVLCAAALAAVDRAVADPADRPVDRQPSRGSARTARSPFRSMQAARPACWRGRLRKRWTRSMPRPPRCSTRCRNIAAPRRRATIMPSARAAVQRGGRIVQRRHHHDVARRHHHRLELGGGAAVRIQRGGSRRARTSTLLVPDDRRPEVQDILRRIGWGESIEHNETVRAATRMASRIEVSLSISPIKSPSGAIIGISKIARDITESQQDQAGAAAADRGASPHLRDLAGSDPGDGSQGISGSGQPELRGHPGLSAGGNDRPQRRSTSSIPTISRTSREEMRAARRGQRPKISDTRYIHKDGRIVMAVMAGNMVRAGQAVSSSSAAT